MVSGGVGYVRSLRVWVGGQSSGEFGVAGVRYSAPVVHSVEPVLLGTAGGEVVRVRGVGFGPSWLATAREVRVGSVVLSGCNVTEADVELSCLSMSEGSVRGPGVVTVGVGGLVSQAPVARYRSPCVSSVAVLSGDGSLGSDGGEVVVIGGREFGAVGTVVDFVVYGSGVALAPEGAVDNVTGGLDTVMLWRPRWVPTWTAASGGVYFAANCTVSVGQEEIRCVTAPGVGAGHVWAVSVGGALSSLCDGVVVAAVTTRYGAPEVVFVRAGGGGGLMGGGGMNTEGGTVVDVQGRNLGITGRSVVFVGGVAVGPLVVENSTLGRFIAPPGVGSGHPVRVEVGGVPSSGNVSVGYGAPVVVSVDVDPGEGEACWLG